ncbi:hypothetical protein GN958_ATG19768 [Phytophthora infestans]|uniref:Uncharacterized protein n=1 Tax=Phytophthora infestans TaxID=4787 RepID=A0A8S9TQ77_PHYIN|nr:hypothetical protein GN958_ATG19768 [Phytophthora infestans]
MHSNGARGCRRKNTVRSVVISALDFWILVASRPYPGHQGYIDLPSWLAQRRRYQTSYRRFCTPRCTVDGHGASISFEVPAFICEERDWSVSDLHLPAPSSTASRPLYCERNARSDLTLTLQFAIVASTSLLSKYASAIIAMSIMEWEAPIPAWIESISIDMDEEMPDLSVAIPCQPINMDDTPNCTPVSTKTNCSITSSMPDDEFETLLESKLDVRTDMQLDIKSIKIVAVSPVKTRSSTAPSISPIKSKPVAKPKAKPGRRPRHKVDVDPSGSNQRRKDKQRGYEKDYRIRMKKKRLQDEAEWIRLETQIRNMLTKRTSVVTLGMLDELKTEEKPSTVCIRQRYLQLLQEERALREAEVLDSCFLADIQALLLWGGTTAPSREVREQLNSLPSLRRCHTFEFSW